MLLNIFEEIEKIIQLMEIELLNNENLIRLLNYSNANALEQSNFNKNQAKDKIIKKTILNNLIENNIDSFITIDAANSTKLEKSHQVSFEISGYCSDKFNTLNNNKLRHFELAKEIYNSLINIGNANFDFTGFELLTLDNLTYVGFVLKIDQVIILENNIL